MDGSAVKQDVRQAYKPPLSSGEATVKGVERPTTTLVSGNICDESEVKKDERPFIG